MTETYWNGLPMPAEPVRVVVDTSPVSTWWCAALAGTERAAVRVGEPGGEVMYLDDEDGSGWWKVTEGRGSPRVPHRSLPVVREVAPGRPSIEDRLRDAAAVAYKGPNDTDAAMLRLYADKIRRGYPGGGSNLTAAVACVLDVVADTLHPEAAGQ